MAVIHIPRLSLGLVLILWLSLSSNKADSQSISNEATSNKASAGTGLEKKDTLEETVLTEMLRIVDQKFDSLSARISVLERSVNNLNFYSVRQFREISESMGVLTTTAEDIHKQVNQMEVDNRALHAAVSQVSRDSSVVKTDVGVLKLDVSEVKVDLTTMKADMNILKVDSAKMFDDIANSIVYFNQNVEERTDDLKTALKETTAAVRNRDGELDNKDTTMLIKYLQDHDPSHNRNCNVDFGPLEERIDLRFAEMKRQTHVHFVDLINAGGDSSSSSEEHAEESVTTTVDEELPASIQEDSSPGDRPPRRPELQGQEQVASAKRDGEKLLQFLVNMTRNVIEAVAYFRHTGNMLERLLTNTETISQEQIRLRLDVLQANRLLSQDGAEVFSEDVVSGIAEDGQDVNNLPGFGDHGNELDADAVEQENSVDGAQDIDIVGKKTTVKRVGHSKLGYAAAHVNESRDWPPDAGDGSIGVKPVKSLQILAELAKNGTQLLDVLTDLAQISSASLTKAVGSLQEEVVRLEDVRARLNEGLMLSNKVSEQAVTGQTASALDLSSKGELRSLYNTTKTIFTIVEAIASNTGWIPYIFHNMQQVERLTNRTLQLAMRSMWSPPWKQLHSNEIPTYQAQERQDQDQVLLTKAEALDVIYDTNIQLQRIMPALTKLLAEPESLIALAGGKESNQGRVEVFYQGQWGPVCRESMGHKEASLICRHLGYHGGIWAGEEQFGRGNGPLWQLNVTCLMRHLCSYVSHFHTASECLTGHFAIICDHMLQMTPLSSMNDTQTGLVMLHHQGRWLPICGNGWSGYEARVACKQMGFGDGRELDVDKADWRQAVDDINVWVSGISCTGEELRLDSCLVTTYQANNCGGTGRPAAVRCQ